MRALRRGTGYADLSFSLGRGPEGLPYQPPAGEFHLVVELAPQEDAMQQGRYPFVVVRHRAVVRWSAEAATP